MDPSLKLIDLIIVGGGPAGIFAAISAKKSHPRASILVLEQTNTLLSKVKVSGGGRCNVTNACFDPKKLIQHYPRGSRELLGPFHVFQPKDMIAWLEEKNVPITVEAEGRVFPATHSSETIINALKNELDRLQIPILFEKGVETISKDNSFFTITCQDSSLFACNSLLLATGSSRGGFSLAKTLGHKIIEPVPSLFSFVIDPFALSDLSGATLDEVELSIPGTQFQSSGSLLITHTGFSGPAALKLSAFAARHLSAKKYQETLSLNCLPHISQQEIVETLLSCKQKSPHTIFANEKPFSLPKNLWKKLLGPLSQKKCKDLSNKELETLAHRLKKDLYHISGKAQHKDEFVTCGGVCLKDVDFRTMESKLCKNLFFAGEILDIDGLTGGFNLQNCWTTGFIVGSSIQPK